MKEHAASCNFMCTSSACDVIKTLIRDRIIIGTSSKNSLDDALKKEYKLPELEKQAREIEVVVNAAHLIGEIISTLYRCQLHHHGQYIKMGPRFPHRHYPPLALTSCEDMPRV